MRSIDRFWKFDRIEKFFLVTAGIFGCLFILTTPPFQVADEYLHFYRAFQISERQWIAQQQAGDCFGYSQYFEKETCLGGKLPKSLLTTVRESSSVDLRFHPERKQDIRDIIAASKIPLNSEDRIFIKFNTTGLHAPIPYLPQAMGISIGKNLNLPPLIIFYLGRVSNLAIWLLLSGLALKITPIGKLLLLLLLLTPMSLFQASSLSADALTNGISFLWIAIVLKLSLDRHISISGNHIIVLSILAIMLCLSKLAYFPLLLLLFLIPIEKFKSFKRYSLAIALIGIASASAILTWSSIVDRIYVPLSSGIFPSRQIEFILDFPLEFIATIWRTFSQEGINYLHQFVGVLGWIDTPLPWLLIVSYFIAVSIATLGENHQNIEISFKYKLGILAILVIGAIVLSSLAYLWNPLGAKTIGGLQGRYFIPFSPLFFMLFYNYGYHLKFSILQKAVFLYIIFACTLSLTISIDRYYF